MTECRAGCGACCVVIVLGFTPAEVVSREVRPNQRERRWIMDELQPITAREAFHRAPWLRTQRAMSHHPRTGFSPVRFFYRCTNYDEESGLCQAHEDRPDVCRSFPTQTPGGWPNKAVALPPPCEFNRDLGRPVAVSIQRRPDSA